MLIPYFSFNDSVKDGFYEKREIRRNATDYKDNHRNTTDYYDYDLNGTDYYDYDYDESNFCGCDLECNIYFYFQYLGIADGYLGNDYFYSCKYFLNPSYPNETCVDYVDYYEEDYDYCEDYDNYEEYYDNYGDYDCYEHDDYYEDYGFVSTMMTTSVMTAITNAVSEVLKTVYFLGSYFNNLFN